MMAASRRAEARAGVGDRSAELDRGDWHGLHRRALRVADGVTAARLHELVEPGTRLDRRGVLEAWGRAEPPLDRTVFAGIRWSPRASMGPSDGGARSPGDALMVTASRLLETVKSDEIAVALGGGLDAAVALAAWLRVGGLPPRVLTLETGITAYDEVETARAIAACEAIAAPIEVVRIEPRAIAALLPEAVALAERPLYNLHPVARYALAREARARGVTTLLTGDGADAILSGIPDDDYTPVIAALVRGAGLRLVSPFLSEPFVAAALASGPDPDKRTARALARSLGLPAWLTEARKHPRLFPATDPHALGIDGLWRPEALARLAGELELELDPGLFDPLSWISLDLLTRALREDP